MDLRCAVDCYRAVLRSFRRRGCAVPRAGSLSVGRVWRVYYAGVARHAEYSGTGLRGRAQWIGLLRGPGSCSYLARGNRRRPLNRDHRGLHDIWRVGFSRTSSGATTLDAHLVDVLGRGGFTGRQKEKVGTRIFGNRLPIINV